MVNQISIMKTGVSINTRAHQKKQLHSPPSPPPPPPPTAKSIIPQPSSIKKIDNEKKGPNWNDVMSELKEKANAKKNKVE